MNVTKIISVTFFALELFLGIITFAIECYYEICQLFIRYFSYHYLESNAREYLVRTRLVYTTTTAFPLIFLPVILLTIILTKRTNCFSVMSMLLGVVGCTLYIATGAVTLASANLTWVSYGATQAFGALAITTGIVYLAHCAYEILKSRDDDDVD